MKEAHLFLYGTLMFDEVWASLGLAWVPALPARLPDHRRLQLKKQPYPGVLPAPGEQVAGVVRRVSLRELERLDRFEGKYYQRARLMVELESGGRLEAFVYRFRNRYRPLLGNRPWDPQRFLQEGLPRFLGHYDGYRRLGRRTARQPGRSS